MVERFQQQKLESAQVGLPRQDNSMSAASAIIAKTADAQRQAVLQQASQQFSQAQQSFSEMNRQSLILANAMEAARQAERKALLSQDVANKQHAVSMQLRDLERATKLDYIANPQAGVEAFQKGAQELASSYLPQKGNRIALSEYAKAFNTEIAQASERMYNWQGQEEKKTVDAAIKENQKQFLLDIGQEADPDTAIEKFLKYSSYLHTSSPRMSPAQHLEAQETIRQGLFDFVKTVATQNPARIEEAIAIAKGLVPDTRPRMTASAIRTEGVLEQGNIDLGNRPVVKNPDGSISTVRSMSFNENGKEVLIPTVVDGKVVSDKEAIENYKQTGQHLGKFATSEQATAYAEQLHKQQEQMYAERPMQRWAPPAITEKDAEEFRSTARQTTKRLQTEAVDREKNILERQENELENATTVTVQRALAQRDIARPSASQVDALRAAAQEVSKALPALQQQFRETNEKLKADPQNLVLLARQGSLNKQIKLLEAKTTQLDNAADGLVRTIDVRNQMAISRAHAEAARQLTAEMRTSREMQQAQDAAINVEIAQLSGKGVKSDQVAAKAGELSTKLQPLVTKMNELQEALKKNPADKRLQNQLQLQRQEVNFLAKKVEKLNVHAEVMQNRELSAMQKEEKNKAISRLDVMKAASVTGDIKAGLKARVAMPWVTNSNGKFKLNEFASFNEAQASLRALESSITDAYKAGILDESEMDKLSAQNQKNMMELQQVSDKKWNVRELWTPLTHAINEPISDMERKGILPPVGTPQYKKFVGLIEKNTTEVINQIYSSPSIDNPSVHVHQNAQKIADAIMDKTREDSRR